MKSHHVIPTYYLRKMGILKVTLEKLNHSRGITSMKLVTVHLPSEFLYGLDELVRMQKYPTRSEAIRVAIRDLLKDELWTAQMATAKTTKTVKI